MTGLVVVRPGLYTTVQDEGRTGYRAYGVPLGGSFDPRSAALANALLGNRPEAAVLELALTGGVFEARGRLALALAGAPFGATLRNRDGRETPLRAPAAFPLRSGERLVLGNADRGARAYLAVGGGWRTPVVLGSRSSETPARPGAFLACETGRTPVRHLDPGDDVFETAEAPLRVIDGPAAGRLGARPLDPGIAYVVRPESNRMGLRLDGPPLPLDDPADRVSAPVLPGAVQWAGGRPLVLGVACGTMGGYPHVAHVVAADLHRLAQARPGDTVRFLRVTLDEARRLDRDARARLGRLFGRIATATSDRSGGPAGVD